MKFYQYTTGRARIQGYGFRYQTEGISFYPDVFQSLRNLNDVPTGTTVFEFQNVDDSHTALIMSRAEPFGGVQFSYSHALITENTNEAAPAALMTLLNSDHFFNGNEFLNLEQKKRNGELLPKADIPIPTVPSHAPKDVLSQDQDVVFYKLLGYIWRLCCQRKMNKKMSGPCALVFPERFSTQDMILYFSTVILPLLPEELRKYCSVVFGAPSHCFGTFPKSTVCFVTNMPNVRIIPAFHLENGQVVSSDTYTNPVVTELGKCLVTGEFPRLYADLLSHLPEFGKSDFYLAFYCMHVSLLLAQDERTMSYLKDPLIPRISHISQVLESGLKSKNTRDLLLPFEESLLDYWDNVRLKEPTPPDIYKYMLQKALTVPQDAVWAHYLKVFSESCAVEEALEWDLLLAADNQTEPSDDSVLKEGNSARLASIIREKLSADPKRANIYRVFYVVRETTLRQEGLLETMTDLFLKDLPCYTDQEIVRILCLRFWKAHEIEALTNRIFEQFSQETPRIVCILTELDITKRFFALEKSVDLILNHLSLFSDQEIVGILNLSSWKQESFCRLGESVYSFYCDMDECQRLIDVLKKLNTTESFREDLKTELTLKLAAEKPSETALLFLLETISGIYQAEYTQAVLEGVTSIQASEETWAHVYNYLLDTEKQDSDALSRGVVSFFKNHQAKDLTLWLLFNLKQQTLKQNGMLDCLVQAVSENLSNFTDTELKQLLNLMDLFIPLHVDLIEGDLIEEIHQQLESIYIQEAEASPSEEKLMRLCDVFQETAPVEKLIVLPRCGAKISLSEDAKKRMTVFFIVDQAVYSDEMKEAVLTLFEEQPHPECMKTLLEKYQYTYDRLCFIQWKEVEIAGIKEFFSQSLSKVKNLQSLVEARKTLESTISDVHHLDWETLPDYYSALADLVREACTPIIQEYSIAALKILIDAPVDWFTKSIRHVAQEKCTWNLDRIINNQNNLSLLHELPQVLKNLEVPNAESDPHIKIIQKMNEAKTDAASLMTLLNELYSLSLQCPPPAMDDFIKYQARLKTSGRNLAANMFMRLLCHFDKPTVGWKRFFQEARWEPSRNPSPWKKDTWLLLPLRYICNQLNKLNSHPVWKEALRTYFHEDEKWTQFFEHMENDRECKRFTRDQKIKAPVLNKWLNGNEEE